MSWSSCVDAAPDKLRTGPGAVEGLASRLTALRGTVAAPD
jgi:hypothetical protein